MKLLLLLFLFLLPGAQAFAAEALAPGKPVITIIDGKKFFSLRGARHFVGSTPPSALMALHRPPQNERGVYRLKNSPPPAAKPPLRAELPASGSPPADGIPHPPLAAAPAGVSSPGTPARDLLSVFTPEEAGAPAR